MKAAVLDDNLFFSNQFSVLLQKLYPDLQIDCFTNEEGVVFSEYDLVFLDIDLNQNRNGIELSSRIPNTCGLFYATAYNDRYVQEVFLSSRAPDGYLLKPVDQSMLKKMLDHYFSRKENRQLELSINSTRVMIPLHQILYLESENHYVQVVTDNKVFQSRIKMSELMPQLSESFVRCHQSYTVNMEKVKAHTGSSFIMSNGDEIPMSRNRKKQAKQAWMAWMIDHE